MVTKPKAKRPSQAAAHSRETESLLPVAGSPEGSSAPHKSIILNVCSFILVTERLAYYGLTGSLPIFFRKNLGINSVLATELNSAFTSLSYLTPLIGAYVADRHLGRFTTIVGFSLLYLAGLALCVVASVPNVSSLPLFMLGLFGGVAFGAGGIKPNVVVLGADQFNIDIPAQRAEKDSFFNWFYWAINIGATFSYGVLTNIAVNGIPPYISQAYGFFASFFVPSAVFVVAFFVFYCGKDRYRRVPPKGSALSTFFAVLFEAGRHSRRGKLVLSGGFAFIPGIIFTTISYFVTDPVWHMIFALSGSGAVFYGTFVLIFSGNCTAWLRRATRPSGGSFTTSQVNDVSQVMRLMPYLSIIIIFWAVYGQQGSNFVLQGCQMDLRFGSSQSDDGQPTLISSAMLSVLDSSVILIFIPIFDKLVYPFMAAISVWWQTPQYLLIGISEILTSISSYDLFYSEVPESMRSVCQALNLLTTTLGYIVAGGLNSVFSFWITSDLNEGKLEYIFYVMAILVLVNIIAFIYVSQSFEYHVPPPRDKASIVSGFSPALPRAARSLLGTFLSASIRPVPYLPVSQMKT
ncbi:hypothetical protein P43SY_003136 [Pythium insidiosum]|uniref:Proton-dependent Oligopeptide Transporter (POT) Family n=1 Tax=Pythium insidiosum TaxID=114742 RepID=A0AAD5LXA0_PYTIN|nr:hypothetical protein P43SY_003136 [Pythium insidiosum]